MPGKDEKRIDTLKFKQLTALAEILADASCSDVIFQMQAQRAPYPKRQGCAVSEGRYPSFPDRDDLGQEVAFHKGGHYKCRDD